MPYPPPLPTPASGQPATPFGLLFVVWSLILAVNGGLLYLWYRWIILRRQARLPREPAQAAGELATSKVSLSVEIAAGTQLNVIVEDVSELEEAKSAEIGRTAGDSTPVAVAPPAPMPNAPLTPAIPSALPEVSPPASGETSEQSEPAADVQPPAADVSSAVPPQPPQAAPPAAEVSPPPAAKFLRQLLLAIPWRELLWEGRWLLLVGIVVAALLAFVLIFAPHKTATTGLIPLPNNYGRPYFTLHFLRDTLHRNYPVIGIVIGGLGGLSALAAFLVFLVRNNRSAGEFSLLVSGITLGGLGQWALNFNAPKTLQGIILYGTAILVLGAWAYLARQRLAEALQPAGKTRWDLFLVLAVVLITAYTRLYAFPTYPYGVEGDEKNWTSEVVRVMVEKRGDFSGEYHLAGVPVTFFMQAPFYALFGAGINSARLAVIFYSILGSLMFFLLLRQIGPLWLAVLGSALLGVSAADISASRLANVESHVKFWPLLTLALLPWAVRKDRWEAYLVTGIALALTVLTFDTAAPIYVLALLAAMIELVRQRKALLQVVYRLAALAFPTLAAAPLLVSYFEGRFTDYGIGERWATGLLQNLQSHLGQVLESWFVRTYFDFIYSRPNGPMTNAFLLPWLIFGIVVACVTLSKTFSAWVLLWAGLVLIPVPVLTERPVARVYYPGLPAAYALIGLGIYIFLRELDRITARRLRVVWIPLAAIMLGWVGLFDQYIYFNEVADPQPRQVIRELGEFVRAGAEPGTHWLIPFLPGANSQLYAEDRTIELYLHGKVPVAEIPTAYEMIAFDDFLPNLTAYSPQWRKIEIIFDRQTESQADRVAQTEQVLERCFPGVIIQRGRYMDRYSLSPEVLHQPACLPVAVTLTAPKTIYWVENNLNWSLSSGKATHAEAVCEQSRAQVVWVEAEDFFNQGGWQEDQQNARHWLGRGFVFDYPDNRELSYTGALPQGERMYAWVRYYKRRTDNSPGMLRVGSQSLPFADIGEERLNSWQWERIGPFDLTTAQGAVYLSRPFAEDKDKFTAIFVDVVVLTTDSAFSPERGDSPWLPVVNQSVALTQPANSGVVSLIMPGSGRYRCRVSVASSQIELVNAYGETPAWSNAVEFEVKTGP